METIGAADKTTQLTQGNGRRRQSRALCSLLDERRARITIRGVMFLVWICFAIRFHVWQDDNWHWYKTRIEWSLAAACLMLIGTFFSVIAALFQLNNSILVPCIAAFNIAGGIISIAAWSNAEPVVIFSFPGALSLYFAADFIVDLSPQEKRLKRAGVLGLLLFFTSLLEVGPYWFQSEDNAWQSTKVIQSGLDLVLIGTLGYAVMELAFPQYRMGIYNYLFALLVFVGGFLDFLGTKMLYDRWDDKWWTDLRTNEMTYMMVSDFLFWFECAFFGAEIIFTPMVSKFQKV